MSILTRVRRLRLSSDLEYLGFASAELCSYSLLAGMPLAELARNLEKYSILVRKFRNELS